jgi:hypothetical protein
MALPAPKRRRSPATAGSPAVRLAAAIAARLHAASVPFAGFGAACAAARGSAGWLDRAAWAGAMDVADAVVEAAEAGVLDPAIAPKGLVAAADRAWPGWREWAPPP